jgi:hypothetical protein
VGRLAKIKRELIQQANRRLLGEHGPPPHQHAQHYQVRLDMCKTNYNEWCCMTTTLDGSLITSANAGSVIGTKVKYNTNLPTHQNEPEHPAGECGIISDTRPWVFEHNQNITCANYTAKLTTMSDSGYDDCCIPDDVPGCTDETAINYDSNATIDDGSCEYPIRWRCKGPRQQVSIRERSTGKTGGSCIEDPNGEFETLQACRESCEAGYGPGYIPDAGTSIN